MLISSIIQRDNLRLGLGQAMTGKTVTRADLCEAVYQKVGLSRTESAALVELVLKEITDCLERGETVKLSSFGSFVVRKKRSEEHTSELQSPVHLVCRLLLEKKKKKKKRYT